MHSPSQPDLTLFEPVPNSSKLLTHIQSSLRAALRLPASNAWVAHWLFANLTDSPFHRSVPLSLDAISLSYAFRASHDISPPASFCTAHTHLLQSASQQATDRVCFNLIPVAESDDILVGYIYSVDRPENPHHPPASALGATLSNPFTPPFTGRYAYDTRCHDLVVVAHGGYPACIGIKSMCCKTSVCREQTTLVVPSAEYTFHALPTTVLSMLSNIEYRLHHFEHDFEMRSNLQNKSLRFANSIRPIFDLPKHPSHVEHEPTADGSWLSDLLLLDSATLPSPRLLSDMGDDCSEAHHKRTLDNDIVEHHNTASSHFPWFVDESGVLADGLTYASGGGECATSSGAFARSKLEKAMGLLKNDILGKYYGPSERMDSLHILTGQYSSLYTGKISYLLENLQGAFSENLRNAFAESYYLTVLSVAADNFLSIQTQEKGIQSCTGEKQARCDEQPLTQSTEILNSDDPMHMNKYNLELPNGPVALGSNDAMTGQPDILDTRVIPSSDGDASSQRGRNSFREERGPNPSTAGSEDTCQALSVKVAEQRRNVLLAPKLTTHDAGTAGGKRPEDNNQIDSTAGPKRETGRGKSSAHSDRTRRAFVLEERRRRNRMSAARSNHRKQQEMEAVKTEIETNLALVATLTERRKTFEAENKRLRQLLEERHTMDIER